VSGPSRDRRSRAAVLLLALVVLAAASAAAARLPGADWSRLLPALLARFRDGERQEGFFTLVDQSGRVLLRTALSLAPGDIFIDPSNSWHRVVRVRGDLAETVDVVPSSSGPGPSTSTAGLKPAAMPLGASRRVIVIYHTHSDESYIPSDGTDSIYGNGGVLAVGDAMAAGLSAAGFAVVHDRTPHDPHDSGAYPRSRRTVLNDLRYGPSLLFDVHRDSAPPADYLTTVAGVETARVMIVIGGGNPLHQGNLDVANRLKAVSDSLYPSLCRGILIARGNYNQDLSPADILLEIGADTTPRPPAEHAGSLWANVVTAYLGPPGPSAAP